MLHIDATDYFVRMLPAMLLMSMAIVVLAYLLRRRARKTLTPMTITEVVAEVSSGSSRDSADGTVRTRTGWRTWVNAGLTITLLMLLVLGVADLLVLFMLGFIVALVVNHPRPADQGEVIRAHAANAAPVVILVLGAGGFTGILTETGMTIAMA